MTLLNYLIQPDSLVIVVDTQVSDADDFSPAIFTTKAYPVPHLEGIITGTGLKAFVQDWYVKVISSMLVQDIPHLDAFAPAHLRAAFPHHLPRHEWHRAVTSTVYHFGYHRGEESFVGYAYRSTNHFQSERLAVGFGLKPPPAAFEVDAVSSLPDDFIAIAEAQKADDEKQALAQRVGIGGQLIAYIMRRANDGAIDTTVRVLHTFADCSDAYRRAADKVVN